MKHKRRYRRYRNKKKKAYILAALILCIVIAAVAVFAISRMAGKEQTSKNQTEVKALVINAEKVDESKLKDLIESAGKINQSVYTDETVNTLNQAKRRGRRNDSGKAKSGRGRRFIFESGKMQFSHCRKIMIFNVMFRFYKMETR